MKKIYIVFFLIAVATSIVGCYEDKGNYDYKDIQKIEISFKEYDFSVSKVMGDTLTIDPKLDQNIDETSANHTFRWMLNGKTKPEWNKKKFEWIADEVLIKANLELKITDKRNDMIYSNRMSVNVTGLFENSYSWMILSDIGGESRLSCMSTSETEEKEGSQETHIKKATFYEDVYTSANGGAELGSGPISMQEHFRTTSNSYFDTQVGRVTVFQQSGAVDLRGEDFVKDLDMSATFVGGQYPAGVILHPGSYMGLIDIIADQYGKLYSRLKASALVFHSEYFLHKPRRADGEAEELSQCKVIRGYYDSNRFGYAVIYDQKNKRLLAMTNSGHSYDSDFLDAGRIEPIFAQLNADTVYANTVPLNNMKGYEMLYMKQSGRYPGYRFNFVLRDESTNKLYLQHFIAGFKSYSPPVYIKDMKCKEILGLPATPTCIALPIYGVDLDYGFFAVGNTLYLLDIMAIDRPVVPYYVFDSNITALNFDCQYNAQLAVGLEDGQFYVMGAVEARNIKEENKILYKAPKKVGKIVDIQYKNIDAWNY